MVLLLKRKRRNKPMRYLRRWPLLLLLLGLVHFVQAQVEIPKNVLFVGNSYTYFWNLPQLTGLMIQSQELPTTTRQSTAGGVNWAQHWRGERGLNTMSLIKDGDFDAVVLQNHSRSAIDRPDSLLHFGQLLNDLIQAKGAKVYLYLSWAREWDPYMQKPITEQFKALAEKTGATLVPVGPAWERARTLRPGFPLYDEDGSHPSILGTYLTACVFYGVFTGRSPLGLPRSLRTKDENGESLIVTLQSQQNALFCQKVAEEILEKWKKDN